MIPLCAACHFRAHREPILFTDRVQQYLGEYEYVALKHRHYVIKKWTITEMEELLKTLKGIQ